jgi:hypothetical protein
VRATVAHAFDGIDSATTELRKDGQIRLLLLSDGARFEPAAERMLVLITLINESTRAHAQAMFQYALGMALAGNADEG